METISHLSLRRADEERLVARFVAWLLAFVPERETSLARLSQLLYLLDWRLTQQAGRSFLELRWQHDGRAVHALDLRRQLERYPRLILEGEAGRARVRRGARKDDRPPPEVAAAAEPYLRFLLAQSPGSLQRLCLDSFPASSTVAGRPFTLEDRRAAYTRARG